ncbi:hypothetical protein [Dyadobacter sandarakinus]|uniref:Phosphate-selective porin O and P n=1 Tax=Dyadobacter sandarakinus TaxID=2747268 RepID=A0ABX7IAH1_9BACT|nr:hypothetical protein [Dyadobacter sandarakinus]QRR02442.1 hypothetical protein HWI92_16750 [Dyadobacter sandarakinus]
MKNFLLVLLIGSMTPLARAQDSTQVFFSQDADTLVRQRFIDRYENVFMTRVPTRQIFKLSVTGSELQGAGFHLGYEYKLTPSLSLEASVFTVLNPYNTGLVHEMVRFDYRNVDVWANARMRWYYNMKKRIDKGLNANNFSGAYIGASYEHLLHRSARFPNPNTGRAALLFGFQTRFLNHGFADFALGLYQREPGYFSNYQSSSAFVAPENFVLGSRFNIGLAVGDWKKSATAPLCDVIFCDELVRGQWKVQAPYFVLGLRNQVVRSELAYERALGKTSFSVQADAGIYLAHQAIFRETYNTNTALNAGLSLRYYFLQKFQARRGKGGSNLSGPYAAFSGGYGRNKAHSRSDFPSVPEVSRVSTGFSVTPALGYQQRLFGKLYIDASLFYLKPIAAGAESFFFARPYLSSRMTIGFTF